MISFLSIQNLVTIKDLTLELENGFTAITGETGAGKSVILNAIQLGLGARSETRWIRNQCNKAEVSIQFDLAHLPEAKHWLIENDFEHGDQECLIRRVLRRDGRSRAYINGSAAKLQQLKELGHFLAILHCQHDSWQLLSPENHIQWVDSFGNYTQTLHTITKLSKDWSKQNQIKQQLQEKIASIKQQSQLNHYFLQELEPLELHEGKVEKIEQRFKQADTYNNANSAVNDCLSQLGSDTHSASNHVVGSIKALQLYSDVFPELKSEAETLHTVLSLIDEVQHRLNQFVQIESDRFEQHELEEDRAQLDKIYELARKHKVLPCELWKFQASLQQFEDTLTNLHLEQQTINQSLHDLEAQYYAEAKKLSTKRHQAAKNLCKKMTSSLKELGLPHAQFQFSLSQNTELTPQSSGVDKFEFLMCANPGQELQPLHNSASGGELSRVCLALQLVCQGNLNSRTMIFDEVDTGISGQAADGVGQQIRQLGEKIQVICITHLAQVASCGHHHLEVSKQFTNDTTETQIQWLENESRVKAIAHMMTGTTAVKTLECAAVMIAKSSVENKAKTPRNPLADCA